MTIAVVIAVGFTLASAVAAVSLRNLVHCALCLVIAFGGLATLFLELGAQFIGLAQILVYVGAVAILIVFAILLTRSSERSGPAFTGSWLLGAEVAVLVFGGLCATILASSAMVLGAKPKAQLAHDPTVKEIGTKLMTDYVLPMEIVALLLTVALIGATVVAMQERSR
jgi:NADH-quinone oxidoreductase subunit J